MKIRKGDNVIVIAGRDKGATGKVIQAFPKTDKVLVEGINIVTKHNKPSATNPQGRITTKEAPIHISNVMPFDPETGKGVRVRYEVKDGKKVRVSAKSGKEL